MFRLEMHHSAFYHVCKRKYTYKFLEFGNNLTVITKIKLTCHSLHIKGILARYSKLESSAFLDIIGFVTKYDFVLQGTLSR